MCSSSQDKSKPLKLNFNNIENTLMRIGFYGLIVAGVVGIALESTWWAVAYAVYAVIALLGGVLTTLCANCPYVYKRDDCLFLPYKFVKRFYSYRGGRMNVADKIILVVSMLGLVVIPQYWLIQNWQALVVFWAFALPVVLAAPTFYCRRCLHFSCPLNCVNGQVRKAAGVGGEPLAG